MYRYRELSTIIRSYEAVNMFVHTAAVQEAPVDGAPLGGLPRVREVYRILLSAGTVYPHHKVMWQSLF